MGLMRTFNRAGKKLAVALSCLSFVALAGCGPSPQQLGNAATDPGLHGTTVSEQVFQGGPQMPHVTVNASALQSGHKYVFEGALTVKGNLPDKTIVEVDNGRLTVDGNVGNQDEIDVKMPVKTHDETSIILMPMMIGKTMTMMPMPVTNTYIDGPLYPADHAPAVTVTGHIGDKVTVTTNGKVQAESWGTEFNVKADYGAKPQQVAPVQTPRPAAPAPGMGS